MTIEEACRAILGADRANQVINSRGVHWAVVEVTQVSTTRDDPEAVLTVRNWLAQKKNEARL